MGLNSGFKGLKRLLDEGETGPQGLTRDEWWRWRWSWFIDKISCKVISIPTKDLTALFAESKYNTYVFRF